MPFDAFGQSQIAKVFKFFALKHIFCYYSSSIFRHFESSLFPQSIMSHGQFIRKMLLSAF